MGEIYVHKMMLAKIIMLLIEMLAVPNLQNFNK